jgi:hypothetical protein
VDENSAGLGGELGIVAAIALGPSTVVVSLIGCRPSEAEATTVTVALGALDGSSAESPAATGLSPLKHAKLKINKNLPNKRFTLLYSLNKKTNIIF